MFGEGVEIPNQYNPIFRHYYVGALRNLVDVYSQEFSNVISDILNQPRYLPNPPVDLLLGNLSSYLSIKQMVEVLKTLKQSISDRFNDYFQLVVRKYPDFTNIKYTPRSR